VVHAQSLSTRGPAIFESESHFQAGYAAHMSGAKDKAVGRDNDGAARTGANAYGNHRRGDLANEPFQMSFERLQFRNGIGHRFGKHRR
jgi:hypothetical protein